MLFDQLHYCRGLVAVPVVCTVPGDQIHHLTATGDCHLDAVYVLEEILEAQNHSYVLSPKLRLSPHIVTKVRGLHILESCLLGTRLHYELNIRRCLTKMISHIK